MSRKKWLRRFTWLIAVSFLLMNVVAAFHAYKFTHFAQDAGSKTKDPKDLSAIGKICTVLFGISNPRPVNKKYPTSDYETITLQSNRKIECWLIKAANPKGSVVICHGYSGDKSKMLDKAEVFAGLGYNALITDFMGSGGSEGDQTTIGYLEAEQVKTCFDYLAKEGERNIWLFGTSMGAAAVMKAVSDHQLKASGLILECPFGTMYQTVCARFKTMNVPVFPMAGLLVFWGGTLNGFWAFGHNPHEYAKQIKCATLLLHGGDDEKVSMEEINGIFTNLTGKKDLKIFPGAGHENYLTKYKTEWTGYVKMFMESNR